MSCSLSAEPAQPSNLLQNVTTAAIEIRRGFLHGVFNDPKSDARRPQRHRRPLFWKRAALQTEQVMTQILKIAAAMGLSLALAGCGGSRLASPEAGTRTATGPISNACIRSDRKAASPRLCGCIQSVANAQLSSGDQRLAATFYEDPQRAQDVRQSDRASNEAFWKRYKLYSAAAQRSCSALS